MWGARQRRFRWLAPLLWGAVAGALTLSGAAGHAADHSASSPWEQTDEPWLADQWEEHCQESFWSPRGWLTRLRERHKHRHVGWGQPLEGTSWLNRPMYAGLFVGPWMGDTLVSGRVNQEHGVFSGLWLGCDGGHYWGGELRLSLLYVDTHYGPEYRDGEDTRNLVGDFSLLYYPWGDSRWRPYASLGVGVTSFHFVDDRDQQLSHTGLSLPLGIGLKYQWRRRFALRVDFKDNLVFGGNGIETTHNWSVIGGFEVHWGDGTSPSYDPW